MALIQLLGTVGIDAEDRYWMWFDLAWQHWVPGPKK